MRAIIRRLYPSVKSSVARNSVAPPFTQPRQASSVWTITFTLAIVGGGAWLQDKYLNKPLTPEKNLELPPQRPAQQSFIGVIDTLATMPAEPAPGTVGNLTPEQELKLKEFWVLALKVFGLTLEQLETPAQPASDAAAAPAQDKKKPKGRWSIWGKGDDDDAKSVSPDTSIPTAVEDDKYGQSKEYKQALEDMKPEEIRTAFWSMVKGDNPDSLLLRFLRARKWDTKKALVMLISTMRWRLQEMHVDDDIMFNGEALAVKQSQGTDPKEKKKGDDFLTQMRLGKSFLHGVDRAGRPICVVRVRLHKAGDQDNEGLERFTVYTIETARLLLAPPIETAVCVYGFR